MHRKAGEMATQTVKYSFVLGMPDKPFLIDLKLAAISTKGEPLNEVHYVLESASVPLVAATSELVSALHKVLGFAEVGAGHDQYDPDLQIVRAFLANVRGGDNESNT